MYPHANTGTCITTNACNFAIGAVLELFIEGQWKLIPRGTSITTRITSPSNRVCPAHRLGWFMKRHSVRQETFFSTPTIEDAFSFITRLCCSMQHRHGGHDVYLPLQRHDSHGLPLTRPWWYLPGDPPLGQTFYRGRQW